MKKRCLFLILFCIVGTSKAQTCLPNGITLTNQAQIDAFPQNYPGCSHILGNVSIEQNQFGGINNLASLSQIDTIEGHVSIRYNDALNSLVGLDNLIFIGGDLSLITNASLGSLKGLGKLKSMGGALLVFSNASLSNLRGLDKLDSIGTYLSVSENPNLTNLTGLDSLTRLGNNLLIQSNGSLSSLMGLGNLKSIGGAMRIMNNNSLTSLSSFDSLKSIEGPLRVLDNTSLTNLSGLDKIDANSITDLSIVGSPQLAICELKSICDYLAVATNLALISGNASGCDSRAQIETACGALVGVKDLDRVETLFYPNPSSGIYKIKGLREGHVKVFSHLGNQLLEKRFSESVLDLSELADGIYFLQIYSGEKWGRQKIVKR